MSEFINYGSDAPPRESKPLEVFIQWKNTDACFDFKCGCGANCHFDGYFANVVQCPHCLTKWEMPSLLTPRKVGPLTYPEHEAKMMEPDEDFSPEEVSSSESDLGEETLSGSVEAAAALMEMLGNGGGEIISSWGRDFIEKAISSTSLASVIREFLIKRNTTVPASRIHVFSEKMANHVIDNCQAWLEQNSQVSSGPSVVDLGKGLDLSSLIPQEDETKGESSGNGER